LGDVGDLARGPDRERLAYRASFLDQLLGLGEVVWQQGRSVVSLVECRLAVAEDAGVCQPARLQRSTLEHVVDDRVPVQRHRQRLAYRTSPRTPFVLDTMKASVDQPWPR